MPTPIYTTSPVVFSPTLLPGWTNGDYKPPNEPLAGGEMYFMAIMSDFSTYLAAIKNTTQQLPWAEGPAPGPGEGTGISVSPSPAMAAAAAAEAALAAAKQQKWMQRLHMKQPSDQGRAPHQLWSPGLDARAMKCARPDSQ
ncbi:TPA: hypothetical protein ACH3X1_002714 [Trebouxia sp. C0004]